jgi:hypothetical protein
VQIFLSGEKRKKGQQYNDEDFLPPHSQGSVLYQELENLRNLFFDCFTNYARKGFVCLFQLFYLRSKVSTRKLMFK